MSKVTAINIIIKKKNQLRKHKEGYVSYINIDEVLVWLNDIQKELEIDMTEEIYNKATCLRSIIEKEKKALKYWKEAIDATDENITLSNGLGYSGYKKASIFSFISFKELKDMAIERLTKNLEQHQKMYEEL